MERKQAEQLLLSCQVGQSFQEQKERGSSDQELEMP